MVGMATQDTGQLSSFGREMSNTSSRLRMLEERITGLRRKLQVIEQNMVTLHRGLNDEVKAAKDEMQGLRNDVTEIKNTLQMIVSELSSFAKREELRTVQKYLTYWEPVKFVTEEQVEKIVRKLKEEG